MRLSKSVIGPREQEAVARVLTRGFLGTGPETRLFEQELAGFFGAGVDVACVVNGTAALHLALQAIGLRSGDEVLVPTLTYVSSFQAVSACGAVPVACDVRETDALLDLADAAARITPRTRAVMPVHYASYPGDLDAVYAFAARHSLRVVEDAAHAFGCVYGANKIGSLGDVACFSFDGIKNITSGEGGAIVSKDQALIGRIRDLRLLGVEHDSEKRYRGERSWEFDVREQGWRYHMSDIMAAIGRAQLGRFEQEFKPARMRLARRYREKLANVAGLRFFETNLDATIPHILPIRIINEKRDAVRAALKSREIETGVHYKPNHLLTRFGSGSPKLPVAERLYQQMLTLPLHPELSDADVDLVAMEVRTALT